MVSSDTLLPLPGSSPFLGDPITRRTSSASLPRYVPTLTDDEVAIVHDMVGEIFCLDRRSYVIADPEMFGRHKLVRVLASERRDEGDDATRALARAATSIARASGARSGSRAPRPVRTICTLAFDWRMHVRVLQRDDDFDGFLNDLDLDIFDLPAEKVVDLITRFRFASKIYVDDAASIWGFPEAAASEYHGRIWPAFLYENPERLDELALVFWVQSTLGCGMIEQWELRRIAGRYRLVNIIRDVFPFNVKDRTRSSR